ncbi:MAG: hypothetical protein WD673_02735 [Alphaproteobacteria bacterium]
MAYGLNTKSIEVRGPAPRGSWRNYVPAILGTLPSGRVRWLALAAILVAAGLAFNWGWLVAIGVAPILLTALPCLAMCALGLCMKRKQPQESQPDAPSHGTKALLARSNSARDDGGRDEPASDSPGPGRTS